MANISDKDVAPVERILWLVSVDQFNPALESLSARMGELQREVVFGVDLPAGVNKNAVHDVQCSQVTTSARFSIVCVLVRLASNLFAVPSSCLFLKR